MTTYTGGTLALAGYIANEQRDIDRGAAEFTCDGPSWPFRHPATVAECTYCQHVVRNHMWAWEQQQAALLRRETARRLKGDELDRYLDECLKDARLTFPSRSTPYVRR